MPPKRNRKPTAAAPKKRQRTDRRLTLIDKTAANESLRSACAAGDNDAVRSAISAGADDWTGGLIAACRNNQVAPAALIIRHRRGRSKVNIEDGMSAACDAGHTGQIMKFLYGTSINCLDGGQLLERSCYAGRSSLVRYLIGREDRCYWPAGLETACSTGQTAVVELLLANGCPTDSNTDTIDYSRCLLMAVSADDDDGFHACGNCERKIGYNDGHPQIVRRFLSIGAPALPVAAINDALKTAIKHATPNDEIISMLIRTATDVGGAFDIGRDAALIYRMLSTTDLPRTVFAGIPNIQSVFDAADRISGDILIGLAGFGFPTDLRRVVASYCINL